ncbi:hypothetical protein [Natronomonas sp. CBA1123]|uniref:DUF7124 domain-containing protein n=1 Tax=Natronomonas sp. CBA1123 TaxID=2668070 RepID=UPI001E555620|nr:hypothetical protein [Natronomonas sp. CBA1123]
MTGSGVTIPTSPRRSKTPRKPIPGPLGARTRRTETSLTVVPGRSHTSLTRIKTGRRAFPSKAAVPGGGAGRSADSESAQPEASEADGQQASGPHGGDADDMTLALTYEAAKRLANPAYVFADAAEWADWLGLVGEVPAHVINRFQREHTIDVDFFSGSGTGPTERLAEIDRHSMFYAERFVLVGVPEEAGWAPDGWEFLPLEDAAEKAEWQVE